jgi:hypothetical protein
VESQWISGGREFALPQSFFILFQVDLVLDKRQSFAGKHVTPHASSIFSQVPNASSGVDLNSLLACER